MVDWRPPHPSARVPAAPDRHPRATRIRARGPRNRPSLATCPQGEPELEARLGVLQPVAEQLAQLLDAVADGLRVYPELRGDGLDLAGAVEPRAQRLGQARAGAVGERLERGE